MLLTITYTGHETDKLGYLLYKNPNRAQQFSLNYGKAYVFYPEVSDERTTVALLLDIDPIELAKDSMGLFDYVNDRPYASTSFMSTAIVRVFSTAMRGKCDSMQELADSPLRLTARLYGLRDGGNEELVREAFEPLGYTVEMERGLLDESFPEWGDSPYINLTISGEVKLCDMLNHLYVLIPVFDKRKHYYMAKDEVDKLIRHGEGWLDTHPYRDKLIRRYFGKRRGYASEVIEAMDEDIVVTGDIEVVSGDSSEIIGDAYFGAAEEHRDGDISERMEGGNVSDSAVESNADTPRKSLNQCRMEAVRDEVLRSGASSVIDLGCGEGKLTAMLLDIPEIKKVTACDVSVWALTRAKERLKVDRMSPEMRDKLTLMQASLTYRDKRFSGYDCACVVEVIEHLDLDRLSAFEMSVFKYAKPGTVVLTTPNSEYNVNYEFLEDGELRHTDHRFEWTRAEFEEWTKHVCEKYDYTCVTCGIGDFDEVNGTPTQMAVFTRCD